MIINVLKIIQILVYVIFFTGGIYLIFNGIITKRKVIKRNRIIAGVIMTLSSLLIMFVLSMFIVNGNEIYARDEFPIIHQLIIISKAIFKCYLDLILFILIIYGLMLVYFINKRKRITRELIRCTNDIKYLKFTFLEKLLYFNLFYETHIYCYALNEDVLISNIAYKELQNYEKNRRNKREKTTNR